MAWPLPGARAPDLIEPTTPVTEQPTKTLLSWSSGKDSAYALHSLLLTPSVEVVGLLTTLNSTVARVSMHGVRESVLDAQAQACGLPVTKVWLPDPCSDQEYREAMAEMISEARARGVEGIAFGDLFLEDVRSYREKQLAGSGIEPLFPLWGRPTPELAEEMVASGVEAIITCIDTEQIDRRFLGRRYDRHLLEELPDSVDPCGENGEFHTFVWDGPMFRRPLDVTRGEIVERDGFVFADIRPASAEVRA